MKYQSTKTYGHEIGLSCAFRQWRAKSHCRFLHGYALSFRFVFEATEQDENGWVVDFGGLKELKAELQRVFDHKTVIARDDPHFDKFIVLHDFGIIDLHVIHEGVGCERFAEFGLRLAQRLIDKQYDGRVRVVSCEVREHGANSAIVLSGS